MSKKGSVSVVLIGLIIGSLLLINACGGGSSTLTPGEAQGVYSGTIQGQSTYTAAVTPDDKFYAFHGEGSGDYFYVDGMMAGQGRSASGSYTGTGADYTSTPVDGTVTATYVKGQSITGTITGGGTTTPFSVNALSGFNFGTPAALSDIGGTWSGSLMNGRATTVTINSTTGAVIGDAGSCNFAGTVTPDTARNFFKVQLTFNGDCPTPAGTGIAISYQEGTNSRHFIIGVVDTNSGTAFSANRIIS